MSEPIDEQIARLARFIIAEIPGEPSQDQGAIDTAMRVGIGGVNGLALCAGIGGLELSRLGWTDQPQEVER